MGAFQQLFQHSSDAVFGINHSSKIVYWNNACKAMLGWDTGDVCGQQCSQVLNGSDLLGKPFCGPNCPISKKWSSKKTYSDFDLVINNKQNDSTWVNIGIYYVPSNYRDEAKGVDVFFSLRPVSCQRLLQRMVNETHNNNTKEQLLDRFSLTTREVDVLRLAIQGMNSKHIAEQLYICPATVKNHFKNIYAKLEVHSRAEAIMVALNHGILPHPG